MKKTNPKLYDWFEREAFKLLSSLDRKGFADQPESLLNGPLLLIGRVQCVRPPLNVKQISPHARQNLRRLLRKGRKKRDNRQANSVRDV
jgi:hypothetical protein